MRFFVVRRNQHASILVDGDLLAALLIDVELAIPVIGKLLGLRGDVDICARSENAVVISGKSAPSEERLLHNLPPKKVQEEPLRF